MSIQRVELPSTPHERAIQRAYWLELKLRDTEKELDYRVRQVNELRLAKCPHRWCVACWWRGLVGRTR